MKILLVGNYSADEQRSMLGFADALEAGLREQGQEVRRIAPRPRLSRWKGSNGGVEKWLGYADKFLLFPPELKRAAAWADIVHVCDQGNAMYMSYLRSVPHLLTCHDLLAIRSALGEFPDWPTGRTGKIYQSLILRGLNQSRHVACVSEATRQDVLRLSRLNPECLRLIPNGLYQPYSPMPDAESEPLLQSLGLPPGRRFLLHVGGNQPYKNRPMTLEIFQALRSQADWGDMRLVLAGKPLPTTMRATIDRLKLTDRVLECRDPTFEHLRALYSRADGLVFPSLDEGFGMPILEAQACGCPVFTSNRAPMTEVGGDAAYFDPLQPVTAAQVIAVNLGNRERMARAGLENARRFTHQRMVFDYLQVYERILNGT